SSVFSFLLHALRSSAPPFATRRSSDLSVSSSYFFASLALSVSRIHIPPSSIFATNPQLHSGVASAHLATTAGSVVANDTPSPRYGVFARGANLITGIPRSRPICALSLKVLIGAPSSLWKLGAADLFV